MTRVVITGMGSINALGSGVRAFGDGLRSGVCAIGELTLFATDGYRSTVAAEARNVRPPESVPGAIARRASRSDVLALIAAEEAWLMAGLRPGAEGEDCGIVFGTTTGGMIGGEARLERVLGVSPGREGLAAWLQTPNSVPVDVLAAVFCAEGPRLTVSTACSSSANALGMAADWVRDGRCARVLCGGTDSLCRMTFSGFNSLQALDTRPCRPFDRARAGLSLGEGAAAFVVEREESARARGVQVLAEVVSYGVSADAHHLTQPRPDGLGAVMAMQRALSAGGVTASEIDYVNAHGTGTPLNDVMETKAIKQVFGAHAKNLPVSSTKSQIGHCLGAAGAIEALACVLALREGFLPPTANLENPDPECDLDYVPRISRSVRLRTVLSNSYGFGGNNTSLILRAVER